MEELKLQLVSLHNINIDINQAVPRSIGLDDAREYILALSNKMIDYKNIREFKTKSIETGVIYKIMEMCSSLYSHQQTAMTSDRNQNISFVSIHNKIAEKLLIEQSIAQDKYKKLTDINKGSLIQSLLESPEEYIYILALVDHNKFIDEKDLKYKIGMPDSDKAALKTARIHLTKEGSIKKIYLSDSRPKISEYWYDGFLDLIESKDDISNTKFAYNALETVLRTTLSKNYSADYNELKNALDMYFTHNNNYTHADCVGFLVDTYEPVADNLNMESLKKNLEDCNTNNIFDTVFSIDTSAIKSKLKNRKYKVNSNIELNIKSPIEKLKENIYTDKLLTEEKVLIIKNVDEKVLKQFNFNKIDL